MLVLGRVSNLPTVWSNCLAAFVLSKGDSHGDLALLMLGASLFYLGGMYLNDAFDAGFDRQFRKERPIPSGAIREKTVWILGSLQLALGFVCFSVAGRVPYSLSILLGASILVYNAAHKVISWSPILMALCRFVLFLAVASTGQDGIAWFLAVDSTGQDGIAGSVLWSAIALSSYIVGLSCVARRESGGGLLLSWWPCLLLSFPAVLAFLVNNGSYRVYGIAAILAYIGWTLFCLRDIYWRKSQPDIGRGVSRLLAGIVLVDLMSIDLMNAGQVIFMAGLFGAALFLQKFIPAT